MLRLMQYIFALVCIGWFVAGDSLKAEDALPKKLHAIEGIDEYRLDNGVQILLFPDSSKPVVTVSMTVFVGSRHEGYGEAGMAHLLEHMLFKGTENHPEIPKLLKDRGANFNGTTWYDRTNYYETLQSEGDNLEFAIRLEADRLVNSKIRGEDLATEMKVVRSEFERGENSPESVLRERMMSTAFQWHNYGKATIGNRSDIERVPVNSLRNFYRKFYRPDNIMLVVAGKFDAAKALALISKYFGVLDSPKLGIDKTYTSEPAQDGERMTVVRRVADTQLVGATYHIPSGSDPAYQAVDILSMVLADEPSGRLYKSLIEPKKASSMQGGSFALHDPGVLFFLAEVPKNGSLEEARDAMLSTLEELAKEPVQELEITRAKTQILKARELRAANPTSLAIELSEWAAQGDWRLYFLNRDRVEKVTAADVQAVAEKYLARNNRTVGLFIPTDKPDRISVPEATDYRAQLANYVGREPIQEGEAFDPTPKNIEERTVRGELASGMPYSFLTKKTRGASVNLSLNLRFGDEKSLSGKSAACDLLGSMLMRGTSKYSFQEINDQLDQLVAAVSIDSSRPQLLQVKIQTKRGSLIKVLEVVESILRTPSFPEKEFDVLRNEQIVSIESQLSNPDALAPTSVVRALNPYKRGDIRYQPTIEEELEDFKNLKLNGINDVYKRMIGGSTGEVSVVGDFDSKEVIEKLDSILNDWKPTVPYHRATNSASTDVKRKVFTIETPDKANAVYYANQQYAMRDDDPNFPALLMGNYVLGGGGLSSRLADRVRQKEGSYSVFSGLTAHPIDERCVLTIYASASPGDKDKVLAAIDEEFKKIIESGVSQEELEAARAGYLKSLQVGRTNDGRLADTLAQNLFAGRTMEYFQTMEAKILRLKVTDVNEVVKEFFDPDGLVIATAGDFASLKKAAAAPPDKSKKTEKSVK